MKIHPTAVIDSAARLGRDVLVGPYVCVEGEVEIGARTVLESHAVMKGAVHVGCDNRIGHGAVIGGWPQDLSFQPDTKSAVIIGDHNVIREHATIHRGTAPDSVTRLGDHNFLMAGAHLGHNCTVGNRVIIANNCLLGGYVVIEDGVFLGGGCVFHQYTRVGQLAIAQGLSGFSKDIPPFCLAAETNLVFGLNVIGLKRAGLGAGERAEIKAAYRLLYESGLNVSQAIAQAGEREWGEHARAFFDFVVAAKKRGICGTRAGANLRDR